MLEKEMGIIMGVKLGVIMKYEETRQFNQDDAWSDDVNGSEKDDDDD